MPWGLVKVELPPGMQRLGTIYQTQNRWYTGTHVRFHDGVTSPVGGSVLRITSALTGKARAMLPWRANDSTRFFAVATHSKLYVATASLTAMVDITPAGLATTYADATVGGGYGAGPYGAGEYGEPRIDADSIAQEATMWGLDNYGQYLVACNAEDGRLFIWLLDISGPTLAAPVTNAPTGCRNVVTTPEGFLVAVGAGGDARKVQWSGRGDYTVWTPSATNQARDYNIQSQGRLQCGKRVRTLTLLFTDLDVHAMQYVGLPAVYLIDRVGENCGVISRGAVVAPDTRAFWMGQGSFFMFDGSSVMPLPCEVAEGVFADLNYVQRSKITSFLNSEFSEAWWLYPSGSSNEIDRAVVYNYKEGHWTLHDSDRLCGMDRGIFTNSMRTDSDGYVYDHETGTDWGAYTPYLESGPAELGEGDRIMRVRRIIFDERTVGDVQMKLITRDWPGDSETTSAAISSANPTPVRISGRQIRQRIEFQGDGRWGAPRFEVLEGSKR